MGAFFVQWLQCEKGALSSAHQANSMLILSVILAVSFVATLFYMLEAYTLRKQRR